MVMAVILSGCATVEDYGYPVLAPAPTISRQGVYHKIKKGETLWRVAQAYSVNINDIIAANNIPDVAHIEENQLVFVPGATDVKEIAPETEDTNANEFAWPVVGRVIRYFGQGPDAYLSKGINISVSSGATVRASRGGRVVFADYLSGYAYTVIVDHQDGYYSVYSKNAKLFVDEGQKIQQGSPLGEVGSDGGSTFVHFQIRRNAVADNPLYYLPKI